MFAFLTILFIAIIIWRIVRKNNAPVSRPHNRNTGVYDNSPTYFSNEPTYNTDYNGNGTESTNDNFQGFDGGDFSGGGSSGSWGDSGSDSGSDSGGSDSSSD